MYEIFHDQVTSTKKLTYLDPIKPGHILFQDVDLSSLDVYLVYNVLVLLLYPWHFLGNLVIINKAKLSVIILKPRPESCLIQHEPSPQPAQSLIILPNMDQAQFMDVQG